MRSFMICLLLVGMPAALFSQEKLLSGPQVGEKLPSFKVKEIRRRGGQGPRLRQSGGGKPIVLVFVHDFNRQSASVTRAGRNIRLRGPRTD